MHKNVLKFFYPKIITENINYKTREKEYMTLSNPFKKILCKI